MSITIRNAEEHGFLFVFRTAYRVADLERAASKTLLETIIEFRGLIIGDVHVDHEDKTVVVMFGFRDEHMARHGTAMIALRTGLRVHSVDVQTELDRLDNPFGP